MAHKECEMDYLQDRHVHVDEHGDQYSQDEAVSQCDQDPKIIEEQQDILNAFLPRRLEQC